MDMELKYEIRLPITKVGHPTPNGLILEPESYKNAIEAYVRDIIEENRAILTNNEITMTSNGNIVGVGSGYLGDVLGIIKEFDIDNGMATIMVREEFKDLKEDEYRLMAALLGDRDGNVFVVKRVLQYFIVPKLKYTNWGFIDE